MESYNVTKDQKRLWFLSHSENVNGIYNNVFGIDLKGALNYKALEEAIFLAVGCHEALRTIFRATGNELRQYVLPVEEINPGLTVVDLREEEAPDEHVGRIMENECQYHFDLGRFPLFRFTLIRINSERHVCIFNIHQVVCDPPSQHIFLRDMYAFYASKATGLEHKPDASKAQMRDYIRAREEPAFIDLLRVQEVYWQNRFSDGISAVQFPGRSNAAPQNYHLRSIGLTVPCRLTNDLKRIARENDTTLHTVLLAAYAILLGKVCNAEDVVIGMPVSTRQPGEDSMIGHAGNTLALRNTPLPEFTFSGFLKRTQQVVSEALASKDYACSELFAKPGSKPGPYRLPVFDTLFVFDEYAGVPGSVGVGDLTITPYCCAPKASHVKLSVRGIEQEGTVVLNFDYLPGALSDETVERLTGYFQRILASAAVDTSIRIADIEIMAAAEKQLLRNEFTRSHTAGTDHATPLLRFERLAQQTPDEIAIFSKEKTITRGEINIQSNRLAHHLREDLLVKPGDRVAVMIERSEKAIIALLGILKAGAVYVPIDPGCKSEQVGYILGDSKASVLLLTKDSARKIDGVKVGYLEDVTNTGAADPGIVNNLEDLCGIMYDPESGEWPAGVMISHANVAHLFEARNERMPISADECVLAVGTIMSRFAFLEFLWPLCHGVQLVIHPPGASLTALNKYIVAEDLAMDFGLFFFANYNVAADDKYKLLLDAVKYADQAGFTAVWTPERHFHEFGALFPNPSVVSSALAMITDRILLRSGSVVSPLHDAIRIAEEWAVVDNLSNGRVELSFAPGWNINDFALSPHNYEARHKIMHEQIDTVKRLWRRESISGKNGQNKEVQLRTFPEPIQKELPVWLTAAGNENTFIAAGEQGAYLLTHLLGQDMAELSRKIRLYREARKRAGYTEASGKVAIMLHTYVGDEAGEIEKVIEKPFIEYLKSAIGLSKILYEEAGLKEEDIPEADKQLMLQHSFKRYYKTAALIGTKSACCAMVKKLKEIGVNEVACLVDFGVAHEEVMAGLKNLKSLKELCAGQSGSTHKPVTTMHLSTLQRCEIQNEGSNTFGESLRLSITEMPYPNKNMGGGSVVLYGGMETTMAGCAGNASTLRGESVIVKPVAGTKVYVLNQQLQVVPLGTKGDIYIGGKGVAKGYWRQPELTGRKFVPDPFCENELMFKTGDTGIWLPDGTIAVSSRDVLGVDDQQSLPAGTSPSTEIEEKLMGIWSAILTVDINTIDANSDFFELGGNSVQAVLLTREIGAAFLVNPGLLQVYNHSSMKKLVGLVERLGVRNRKLIPVAPAADNYPVSYAQEMAYQRHLVSAEGGSARVFGIYKINMNPGVDKIKSALQEVVHRHESLQTVFSVSGDKLMQRAIKQTGIDFCVLDRKQYTAVEELVEDFSRPFDLFNGPLIRFGVLQHNRWGDLLLVDAHGLICDQNSLHVLIDDLRTINAGNEPLPRRVKYTDYACWLRDPRNDLTAQEKFWREKLSGDLPIMDLPFIHDRSAIAKHRLTLISAAIDGADFEKVMSLKEETGASFFAVTLSAYFILLSKITEQRDIIIGVEADDRPQAFKRVIGNFMNTLPLRMYMQDQPFKEFLNQVEVRARHAADNMDYHYYQMLSVVQPDRSKQIADVFFRYHQYVEPQNHTVDLIPFETGVAIDPANHALMLEVHEQVNGLMIDFVFSNALFDEETVGLFKAYYLGIVSVISENPGTTIGNLSLEGAVTEYN